MGAIIGEDVAVSLLVFDGEDAYGNRREVYGPPQVVRNVLVGKGATHDGTSAADANRHYKFQTDIAFCFPRDYAEDLRGAVVTRLSTGRSYTVVGDPEPLTDANIPPGIDWNIRAEGVRRDG